MTNAELLHATQLALRRFSVIRPNSGALIAAMTEEEYTALSGRLTVQYVDRDTAAVFEWEEGGDGTRVYTCLANRATVILTPTSGIYTEV